VGNWSSNGLIVNALSGSVKLAWEGVFFLQLEVIERIYFVPELDRFPSKARCSEATRFSITKILYDDIYWHH